MHIMIEGLDNKIYYVSHYILICDLNRESILTNNESTKPSLKIYKNDGSCNPDDIDVRNFYAGKGTFNINKTAFTTPL